MPKNSFIQRRLQNLLYKWSLYQINTPLQQAVDTIKKRRKDASLCKEISNFLKGDIPAHFTGSMPVFYLSRYIATPDYETLQYVEQVQKYNLPIIIGEDTTDIFTSHSSLKRNLVKLPIVTGTTKNGSGIVEYATMANFNTEQGKKMKEVMLFNGQNLPTFHNNLAKKLFPPAVQIVDESAWVDAHSRGKLVKLYEDLLALFIVNGIMLECYEPDEIGFLQEVVIPAYRTTKKRFGYTPLIVPLEENYPKKIQDVNSYPATVLKYLE